MSKEEILEPLRCVWPSLHNMGSKVFIKYPDALKAMDDYTEQLRTELESVKKERDELKKRIHNIFIDLDRGSLEHFKIDGQRFYGIEWKRLVELFAENGYHQPLPF